MSPTDTAPIVVTRTLPNTNEPTRQIRLARWGLVPSFASDTKSAARMMNARSETLLTKPAFRAAARSRRALVPAHGWFEWQHKKPHYLTSSDTAVMAFAGLYEFWHDPTGPTDSPKQWLTTFTIITTQASERLTPIHNRMPLIVPQKYWTTWLDVDTDRAEIEALMGRYSDDTITTWRVSTEINNSRSEGAHLIDNITP